jgi:phosphopantothenoylcysteine synthetase/decarboxylase
LTDKGVAYLIASGAPPVLDLSTALQQLEAAGWTSCVILTPTAASWLRGSDLEDAGRHLRVEPRHPAEPDPLPDATAVLAAPLTFNTINKWAAGVSDTLALGLLNELLGAGLPIVGASCVKAALRRHPAWARNIETLGAAGVRFLDQEAITRRRSDGLTTFDWAAVVAEFQEIVAQASQRDGEASD